MLHNQSAISAVRISLHYVLYFVNHALPEIEVRTVQHKSHFKSAVKLRPKICILLHERS